MSDLFERHSLIGFILKITGVVVIAWGIIEGFIVFAEFSSGYGQIPIVALKIFATPIVIGLLIIGFGEVIDLLQRLLNGDKSKAISNEGLKKRNIPFFAEQEIKGLYPNKELAITPTHDRAIFQVGVDDRKEYIEVGGNSPRILTEAEAEKYIEKN